MTFNMEHSCIYVADLERTKDFYQQAFHLEERRRKEGEDRHILFLGGAPAPHQIEVIQMKGRETPWALGENPTHLAFRTDDYEAAMAFHKKMGCFHHEMVEFGVYFVTDPDGYLSEVMPTRK